MEIQRSKEHGEVWGSKLEYYLACVGFTVGLANTWRLSVLCYYNGGVAYLIPFLLVFVLFSIPMLYMEMAIGQLIRLGPVRAMSKLCPLLKGTGVALVILSLYRSASYMPLTSLSVYYFFMSFSNPLPWKLCDNAWNTPNCVSGHENNSISANESQYDLYDDLWLPEADSSRPAEEYFKNHVLQQNEIYYGSLGGMRLELVGCLCFAWVICYFCVFNGVRLIGKVSYVTTAVPFLFMIVLLIKFLTLPGAGNGIKYFLLPNWSKLADYKIWIQAITQNVYFLELGAGLRLTYSSYNQKVNNVALDTLCFALISLVVSLFGGLMVFSGIGGLAHILETDVPNIVGEDIFFVVLPSLLTHFYMPGAWAAIMFLMVFCFGINLQIAYVQVLNTTLLDTQVSILKKLPYKKAFVALPVCLICFLLGLPFVTQGGRPFLFAVDHGSYIGSSYIIMFQVMAVWIYGPSRLAREISFLSRYRPPYFFPFCWLFILPLMTSMSGNDAWAIVRYFSSGMQVVAYLVFASVLICVPIGIIHTLVRNSGTCGQRCKKSFTPSFEPTYVRVSIPVATRPTETFEMDSSDRNRLLDENAVGPSTTV